MEKYIMISSGDRVFIFTIADCPEGEVTCLPYVTEEELYGFVRKMDCEISFTRPYHWAVREEKGKISSSEFIFIKEGDYFHRVNFQSIRWIKAEGSYCRLCTRDQKEHLLSFNLTELAAYLPVRDFIRVHRSYIVNINYVDSFFGNTLIIDKNWIPISKLYRKDVIRHLNLLGYMK